MNSNVRNALSLSLCYVVILSVIGLFMIKPSLLKVKILQQASISPVKGIDFRVENPLIVKVNNKIVFVPEGFETDLASIPRWLWAYIAPNEAAYVFPSILHDYLYMYPDEYCRKEVDEIFYSFLIERGVSQFKAYQFYFAVRIFGGHHFHWRK